jgi:translation initiation factor IF-2
MMELGADPDRAGIGRVVEAGMRKGFGAVSTILVQSGTVRVGDIMVSGAAMGRVRSMMDERGNHLEEAGPSTPVEIAGFSEVPQFADRFYVVSSEKIARTLVSRRDERLKKIKSAAGSDRVVDLESLFARVEEGKIQELNIIVKADVHGSVVALSESLEKIHEEDVRVKVVHSGVGPVSESDIMLASTSGAIIICFHVRNDSKIEHLADEHHVQIKNYRIIYEAIDDINKAMHGMLKPKFEEIQIGRAVVREVFTVSKIGRVAGCFVEAGKIVRGAEARLVRDSVEVYRGRVENVNRFKDSVNEVLSGYECGINIKYNDIKPKDQIEVFENVEVSRDRP